jgi:hypothetical protein
MRGEVSARAWIKGWLSVGGALAWEDGRAEPQLLLITSGIPEDKRDEASGLALFPIGMPIAYKAALRIVREEGLA